MSNFARAAVSAGVLAVVVAFPGVVRAAQPKADASKEVRRVVSLGKDGTNVYYRVECSDGRTAGLRVDDALRTVCVHRIDDQPHCDASWTLRDAAVFGCGK